MGDGDIDYSGYTLLELEEALAGIDKGRYPGNYANLRMAYRALTGAVPEERTAGREMVEEREERVRSLLSQREEVYTQAADVVIDTSECGPQEIAEKIVEFVRQGGWLRGHRRSSHR